MKKIFYLTKDEYLFITKKLEGDHWEPNNIERRWDYHSRVIELIKAINISNSSDVLEMGTMGVNCVKDSDTIDYLERWDYKGKQPTYMHDARIIPWPINDKQYEVFIALRVFQHLTPNQKDCLKEAIRVAKKVIIVAPRNYNNKVLPNSKGISYINFVNFLEGIHPNLVIPTAFGDLYYWDTENPSTPNALIKKIILYKYKYSVYNRRKIIKKINRMIKKILRFSFNKKH